ncbi:MAG: GntR family transcriptional regulator [Verrucomicrobia bacterium]|nr:GntR family transcriptional regulator [Verrucomicrobiota bacterium]
MSVILKLIRTGQIAMGSRVSEVLLSRRLQLGRAPVRAALDRLASVGVVERLARAGTFVREVDIADYCEIFDVRAGLEGMAGYLATRKITEVQLEQLEKVATKLDQLDIEGISERSSRDEQFQHLDALFALDFQFHMGIAQICGNRRIIVLLEQQHLLERSFILGIGLPPRREKPQITYPDHRDIVKALRGGEPKIVRDTIQASLLGTKESVSCRANGSEGIYRQSREEFNSPAQKAAGSHTPVGSA